ncbi:MAG: chromosome segregation protein SMC [Eubacteriales bacterium]|nr:chromosome segregation protein SMC [Eubacteriales bacterium]
MYLKSIEIQGFKSFAHKTVLNFNMGMTAIVGPNGSGKSNIADAVRWVLGEQKVKQLRGSSMQDVIFAGTELRKPLGFAFVSLTFDNTDHAINLDYSEVTVSRKLYRSGESEYILNGQTVRLKDIQELFFDTGIGKEGYSIIGQGQVETIINGRPEDRRGIFDEACGITKFKKRKIAALKKLEDEKANLLRITDILGELEKRVGPLARQSESAREYLKLRDELKKNELNLFARETENDFKELEALEKNIEIIKSSIDDVKSEDEALMNKNTDLSEKLRTVEETLQKCNDDKLKGELLVKNLESQIGVCEAEIEALKRSIAMIGENLEKTAREQLKRYETINTYLGKIDDLEKDLEAFEDKAGEFLEESDEDSPETLRVKLEEYKEKLTAILPKEYAAKDEAEATSKANASDGAEGTGEPDEDDDEFLFAEPEWLKAIKNKRDDLSDIREREQTNKAWIEKASEEYNSLTMELKAITDRKNTAFSEYNIKKSKYEAIRNVAERYEGYGSSVQNVMQLKGQLKGIKGVVADIISTKPEFEVAIETALGGRIQNIVTDNERTATDIIGHLKKNRLGRATFLPLDAVKGRIDDEYRRAVNEEGCLGIASELVETGREYEDLVKSLLGNTLVVKNVDYALRIAGRHNHNLRIVTLEGELLSKGGAIAGGSYKNSSNLMGRNRETQELKELTEEAYKKYISFDDEIRECEKRISEKNRELEKLLDEQKEINERKNSLSFGLISDMKLKFSNLKQTTGFIEENIDRITGEIEAAVKETGELTLKKDENEASIGEKTAYIEERRSDIESVRNGLKESEEMALTAGRERETLAASQAEYFERKNEISGEILGLEKDLLRLEASHEKQGQKIEQATSYIWTEYELTLSDAKKEYDESLGSLKDIKEKVTGLKAQIKALGPINIQAIEEYKETAERYELYKTQHDDIAESQAVIEETIKELDEGMKKQFSEQFALIGTEFKKTFSLLFGGGEASLELVVNDDEEVLDELSAGIAINAQPPGKKLQNMMQLSGGEKALTAIALLFAIQNLKPSPFCLLDEIEAALDDTNVLRFANYVKDISDRSQFILITHRRGTMESADRLYGITMQEKGVTSLVSVDLVSDVVK